MQVNRRPPYTPAPRTHEGAVATPTTVHNELQRSVLACMLWEDTFYESGIEIAQRIKTLVSKSDPSFVRDLAVKARLDYNLRHAPLHLILALIEAGKNDANFRNGIADLKKRRFVKFTDNFLRIDATPGNLEWQDDQAWSKLAEKLAAKLGCDGPMLG